MAGLAPENEQVHKINILSKREVPLTSKYLNKVLQNIKVGKNADQANILPSKKKPLIRKECEHLRKTDLKFTVTYNKRSQNKKVN